jgi:hypothetical protein
MLTARYIYLILIISYAIIFVAYCFKFEISYRIVQVRPEMVEKRSLSFDEYNRLNEADLIRRQVTLLLLMASAVVMVISITIWYFQLFKPTLLPKIVMVFSGLCALILAILNNIHFIPHAPIR